MESNLHAISNSELISRMEKLVRTERKITHLVLLHICEIETRRLYAERGFDGMFSYLTRGLGYSEAAAYRRLQSARLLRQIPEVAERIQNGVLNLSQLTQVQKCVKAKLQTGVSVPTSAVAQVLEKIENKNSYDTEMVLAQEFNRPIKTQENLRPQKDHSVRIEITLTAEQFIELQKAKDFLSHAHPHGDWAEVISSLARRFNNTKMGSKKTVITPQKKSLTQNFFAAGVTSTSHQIEDTQAHSKVSPLKATKRRKYISSCVRREVFRRAQNCCEYTDPISQHRCRSTYQLQIEHIKPLALNGGDELHNLKALCRTHNLLTAKQSGLL